MKKIYTLLALLIFSVNAFSQAYFKYYNDGKKLFEDKKYDEAIVEFDRTIENKPDHHEAWNMKGLCYEAKGDLENAIIPLTKATEFKEKEGVYHADLGRVYFNQKKYTEAVVALGNAIDRDKKLMDAYEQKVYAHIALNQYPAAEETAKAATDKEKTGRTFYNLGVAQDSLMKYEDAAYSFGRAKFYEGNHVGAYIGLAYSYAQLGQMDKATEAADKAVSLDGKSIKALIVRFNIYTTQGNSQKAIDDISKIITLDPENVKYYNKRANMYKGLNQYQNAIGDYSKAIQIDKNNYLAFYERGQLYETINDVKLATKDYEMIIALKPAGDAATKIVEATKKRVYEINKESKNPEIEMIDPISPKPGLIAVPKGTLLYTVKGRIKDQSRIEFIKVNGKDAIYNKDSINPKFELEMNLAAANELTITAFDVYQNSETWTFAKKETETDAPVVKLVAPYASDDGTIYLDADDPTLYIEGIMQDESLIKSIMVEGSTASFMLQENNPKFSATINIQNKDGFTIIAEDEYGNKVEKTFTLNRENIELLANNPMGKTWVIFIENANYKTFASLDGPTKDVTMMKSAFAKYKVHNIVHKKDMSKAQLEKFFSIELRDLVRSNRVNSLLVWYAGHGKYINETGYWIPVDAKRDDEFTYFNINNLKAGMQSYSKDITHTLVVTDACESGPSFYQAMRATNEVKSCNDWQATKFKSSQVFSSAGYELATDNSQFTKTFANTLTSNPDACIPIETVVNKVSTAVAKSGANQKPKFGKIAGLEDENGTFFFIKK